MKKATILTSFIALFIFGSSLFAQEKTRTETDLLGDIKVPTDAYYGAQAARAMENFQVSGQYISYLPLYLILILSYKIE